MPITVQFDTVQNAAFQQTGAVQRMLRGVTVTGIDTTALSDPAIMAIAKDAIIAYAGQNYPGDTTLLFSGLFIRGIAPDSVAGYAEYSSLQGLQPSSYIIRNISYVQGTETNLVPGTRIPIMVGWEDQPTGSGEAPSVDPDLVTMRFNLPVKAIAISGLVYGKPTNNFEDFIGYVNDNDWGPPGKPTFPAGFWILQRYQDATAVFQGYYTYEAVAANRVYADWSETGVLRDSLTGKYVKVDESNVTTMNALPYKYGIIYPNNNTSAQNSGIIRVGGNHTTNFPAIFGF